MSTSPLPSGGVASLLAAQKAKNLMAATPPGDGIAQLLSSQAIAFPAQADDIEILNSPAEFYARLLDLSSSAEQHISLSSLYLGTGEMEQKLMDTIADRCREKADLKVHIMLDYMRGTRLVNGESSVSMVQPLMEKHPHASLSLFHVPCSEFPLSYVLKGTMTQEKTILLKARQRQGQE